MSSLPAHRRVESRLKTDKRTETFSVRIPEITAHHIGKLSPTERTRMFNDLLLCMAYHIHNSSRHFDPSTYLSSHDDGDE